MIKITSQASRKLKSYSINDAETTDKIFGWKRLDFYFITHEKTKF